VNVVLWLYVVLVGVVTVVPVPVLAEPPRSGLPDLDSLWNYEDPAASESTFRELVGPAAASGDSSYYLQLLTQIARAQGLQGRFNDAHATLDTVQSLVTDHLPVAQTRYLLERGRVYNSSGSPDESQRFFLEAWGFALEHGSDYYVVDALHMMGIVTPPEEQLKWSLRALRTCERAEDEKARKWLGPLYNNIGWTYHDLGQYEEALSLFEKSLAWRLEQKDEYGTRIARWTVGRVYRSLGRIDEALEIHRALEHEIRNRGLEADGYVFEELAECLLLKGEESEARSYAARAYDLLSQDPWLVKNDADRLERLRRLGAK
jgi:tetratricopeptide (TPR) repeat protein